MKKRSEPKELTSVQVSVETRDRLKERGKKGETYDEIITRLLKEYEERNEP